MDTRSDADADAGAAAAAAGILPGQAEPPPVPARPSLLRSLSGRLLVLTIIFVMLSEVLIYVPSVARFQQGYLQGRVEAAYLASLAITAAPEKRLDPDLAMELLHSVGAMAVALKAGDQRALILGAHPPDEMGAVYDLRDDNPVSLIADTFTTILGGAGNALLVVAQHPGNPALVLEIVLDPAPLQQEIADYSSRIFLLSLMISLITASLVFLALYILMVRPMRRLTSSMIRFSRRPEDADRVIRPSGRRDEIGIAEVQLAHMQAEVRTALAQQKRLAALGAAVAKISHDLRNILAGAQLLSDRLSTVEDPTVQRVAPRLIASVDRAIALCARTLQFGKAEESPPQRRRFALHGLVEEVAATLDLGADGGPRWRNDVPPGLLVDADPEQLYRVLLNLMRNAVEAMAGRGELSVLAVAEQGRIAVEVADTGPGLPDKVRTHLFEPFRGSRSGGTGLGLTIALELVRAHGGDLRLLRSDGKGTTFRLELPDRTA